MAIFIGDQVVTVTTVGSGTLSLLTYGSEELEDPALPAIVGSKTTNNAGETRWVISFSHAYFRWAFIWEGAGASYLRIGASTTTQSVGTSWEDATLIHWGDSTVTQGDATAALSGALNRDNATTFWVIPNDF